MSNHNFLLIRGDEDGRCVLPLSEDDLAEFLRDPKGYASITTFETLAFLGEEPDPMYWPDGVGVLVRAESVVPVPAGAYVLESS